MLLVALPHVLLAMLPSSCPVLEQVNLVTDLQSQPEVKLLGKNLVTAEQCRDACTRNSTTADPCHSWTFIYPDSPRKLHAGYCWGRHDLKFDPIHVSQQQNLVCSAVSCQYPPPPAPTPSPQSAHRNVLYIMVDDLRAQLGCYGHNDTVRSPNIDALAASGTLFQHAYVQIAVCSPSRTSFLTGLRPWQENVLNFKTDFRRATPGGPGIISLPQWFKSAGFLSTGMGKTFHPNLPADYDEPLSWSADFPYITAKAEGGSQPSGCGNGTSPWCSMADSVADNDYADGQLVTEAIRQLTVIAKKYKLTESVVLKYSNPLSRAFFMAVGLHRPHMDWVVPKSFLDRQPPASDIKLATHQRFNSTSWAFYNCTELTDRPRLARVGAHIEPDQPLATSLAQEIRRNYFAAVEYMDSQVGRLMQALEQLELSNSTAIVFHGDHGWKLGEAGMWCKETNFENDARVPLLVRAPWLPHSVGLVVSEVVELVDIFPTLAALTGVKTQALPAQLDGRSLVPLMEPSVHDRPMNSSLEMDRVNAQTAVPPVPRAAFSLYPRWHQYDTHAHCYQPYKTIEAIGLSVRTADFRLTDWTAWNASASKPMLETILASQLYDHRNDTGIGPDVFDAFENANLADELQFKDILLQLRGLLRAHFSAWPARIGPQPPCRYRPHFQSN